MLIVERRENAGGGDIPWETLMQIKADMLGAEVCAIEIYPPLSQLHMTTRHYLFEVPTGLPVSLKGIAAPEKRRPT